MKPDAKPEGEAKPEGKTSLLNEKDAVAAGAPEKYEEFKAPEHWKDKGLELDPKSIEAAIPLFKELNISQEGAQKLVDFYTGMAEKAADSGVNTMNEMRAEWRDEIKADKEIGHKLPQVKADISKAIDTVLGRELGGKFREALDITGGGDNPSIVRGLAKFASKFVEGKHVAAGGPSKFGQAAPGKPQDAAHALYPHLP